MSRVIHELLVRDRGLPTERVAIRSSTERPCDVMHNHAEMQYFETVLYLDESKRLAEMMKYHHESLARAVGYAWVGEPE